MGPVQHLVLLLPLLLVSCLLVQAVKQQQQQDLMLQHQVLLLLPLLELPRSRCRWGWSSCWWHQPTGITTST